MPRAHVKTQVYLPAEDLEELTRISKRSGRSIASLVREAVSRTWLGPRGRGPVGVWDGEAKRASTDHDAIWNEP